MSVCAEALLRSRALVPLALRDERAVSYRVAVFTPPVTWHDCLALRITLQHVEPPVWRLIHAPAWLSLAELHEVIQLAFGWKNCHLHDFYSSGIRFGSPSGDEPELIVDERAAPLGAVARVGGELLYHYDFGDDWEHRIVVESVIANGSDDVVCAVARGRARPRTAVARMATRTCSGHSPIGAIPSTPA